MAERWLKKSLLRLFSLNACNWKCSFLAIGKWNVSGHLDFRYFVWSGLQQFLHKLIIWLPFEGNMLSKTALPYWNLNRLFNEWKVHFGKILEKKKVDFEWSVRTNVLNENNWKRTCTSQLWPRTPFGQPLQPEFRYSHKIDGDVSHFSGVELTQPVGDW